MSLIARLRSILWPVLAILALTALVSGGAAHWSSMPRLAALLWNAGAGLVLAFLLADVLASLLRGHFGVDIIAALSISTALVFGEPLAGVIVALMYSGGQQLENFAEGRARREMTALLGRVARTAMRHGANGLEEVPIEVLRPGDRIMVRHGEVVPTDGVVDGSEAEVDMSALTGETMPVRLRRGAEAQSGCTSVAHAFDLVVSRPAAESTYAGIVRLVEQAQQSRAPMMRIADRYAVWFLAATLVVAGLAWWLSGDRQRALAVLVVATPCPLILAVPVAIISGLSRAASFGVLIKNGGALEMLARVRTAVLDKTGTLTSGSAGVIALHTVLGVDAEEMLRLAASLDQASGHTSAEALVKAARRRGHVLASPTHVRETPGSGLVGVVEGREVVVGGSDFVRVNSREGDPYALGGDIPAGAAVIAVALDGRLAGIVLLADQIRGEARTVIQSLRRAGIRHIVLASGDRLDVVETVGRELGLDGIRGEVKPAEKVDIVLETRRLGPVMMVGDGVNDAPALAAADLGVAMGATGAAASSEVADIVLLVDDLGRLARALSLARRTRRIALQSVAAGIGLSLVAMAFAAFGYLPPVQGALLQELIDVAVILNALRVLSFRGGVQPISSLREGPDSDRPESRSGI